MHRASRHLVAATAAVALLVLPLGVALGAREEAPKDAAAAEKKAEPAVTGRVLFEGELPVVKDLDVPARAAEGCCPPGKEVDRTDMSLRISKDRGIAGAVVTVKVAGKKVELPKEPYLLDQKGCRFTPHVLVVPKGGKVAFLNSDETSHNVHLISVLNDPLNQTVLAGKRLERTFDEAEAIKVTCDMHTWMKSWVVVTDATHWAVTDEEGHFSLAGLPPEARGHRLARDPRKEDFQGDGRGGRQGRRPRGEARQKKSEAAPPALTRRRAWARVTMAQAARYRPGPRDRV